eukprot:CAMPEP_0183728052 /NCGR_PEP_ID=MMETSP0737-20130205/27100_1 /TAXON_ID=385413 /ORGANISM="Thalassiosira miniscula, Strain CCMP1093" /LENGTH=260 /DNA_ID=CAMNT_0025959879 /DNA_START=53 /DNA_END=836 /DNA_ORIENTATION=-
MAQQSKQRSSTMHQPQHRISESMSNYHDDDYPSRPPQRPPRRSRSHADAFDRPEQSFEENQSRSRPQRQTAPQHHALSPEMGDASTFDFFYQLIFSIVHAALSLVLSPVLGNGKGNKVRSSSQSLQPKMDDPELAMEEEVDYINPSYVRTNSNNGAYAPILRTDARRSAGEIEKKSVRFPEPSDSALPWAESAYRPLAPSVRRRVPLCQDRLHRDALTTAAMIARSHLQRANPPISEASDHQDPTSHDMEVEGHVLPLED